MTMVEVPEAQQAMFQAQLEGDLSRVLAERVPSTITGLKAQVRRAVVCCCTR